MINILPVASGKGGVGKTSLSVNLAISLAKKDKKVILADFDFGGANLHTLLGLKNNHAGLGNFIYKQTDSFRSLLQDTPVSNLKFIAGDCLFPGTPNLGFFIKQKLIKEIQESEADYFIMDLGGGTAYNTLDFFLLTYSSILVSSPEITSILNAYSFLKAAAYRFFTRQFKPKSEERVFIRNFIAGSAAGAESSFTGLVQELCARFPATGPKAASEMKKFAPQVIINMGNSVADLEMARRLRSLAQKKLGIRVDFIGFLPKDDLLPISVARRSPIALTNPASKFMTQLNATAERILHLSYDFSGVLSEESSDEDDLERLTEEFDENQRE